MSAANSIGSIGSASAAASCPTCGVNVEAAFSKIDTARRKLQLRQETLQTEQALLKADKRNFKRRLQAAKAAAANSQITSERVQAESAITEQAAKRKYQEYQKQLELGSEKQKESERQHQQEIESLKKEFEELRVVDLQKQEKDEIASPSGPKIELGNADADADYRIQIDILQQELETKESALESCEMQLLELERDRDDGYTNSNNTSNTGDCDDLENGADSYHNDKQRCLDCNRLEQKLQLAEQDLDELRVTKETEESRLSCLVTDLNEKVLEATSTNNELTRLREELEEMKAQEQEGKSTIAAQKQQLEELTETNRTMLDRQQFRDAASAQSSGDCDNTNTSTAQSQIQRPSEPDETTHRHVMEFEWHGPKEAGVYTGWLIRSTDNPDGPGTLRVDDGAVYDGDWKDGKRHGQGVLATLDGDIYRGGWCEGAYYGYGVFVWSDGRLYRGDYNLNGERHGNAIMTWPYGAHYQGEYAHDKRNGQGTYVYADGRCYMGEYRDEKPHGYGQLKAADGTIIYDGAWEFGEYLGHEKKSKS
jgi:hypothetical protein